jgi:hypothetical protein
MFATRVEPVTNMSQGVGSMIKWFAVPVVLLGAIGLFTAFFLEGRVNQQVFAASCIVAMALAAVVWTAILKRAGRPAEADAGTQAGKKKAVQIALLVLFLIVAFWMTRGGLWIPRLIGAFILLLFTIGIALRKAD